MEKDVRDELEKKYFATKEELDIVRDNETLLKWEVLSKANKLGKRIWGKKFTTKRLSIDMGLPYTTTKRCLALDNATKKSWELLKQRKITAFKLAMVCQLKTNQYQDDIVQIVIKDNLSTYQIKGLKPKSIKDVNEWRHKKAVEKGYSRQDSAFRQLNNWINRGLLFMMMPISSVGPKHKEEILDNLRLLELKIGKYLKKHG